VLCTAFLIVATALFAETTGSGTFDGGGGVSTSANFNVVASLGGVGGDSAGGSVSNSSGGTVTQPSAKSLTLNASPGSINQGATSQLSGTAAMDDDSVTSLSGTDIAWGIVTYPFQSVASNGVLTAVANVYATASGTVNGSYDGVPGSTSVQVLGPYAGSTIPESWFNQYFGPAPNPNAAPDYDATGTGQNNLFKYVAGLDPTNAASKFVLRVEAVAGEANQKRLVFNPRWNDRTYAPQFRTDLVGGAGWTNLLTTTVTDNGAERTLTDTNATGNARFYRIQITYP
jgi:hypothetical protein